MCFIDCPPSLGLLTLNALTAADTLLVPLQCEFFALEGLSQLLQTVEQVQQRFNPDLGIVGIALTMFDRRNRLTDQVADDVRECLGKLVFESVIPRNVRLSEAPSHGLPALVYDHVVQRQPRLHGARARADRPPAQGKDRRMSADERHDARPEARRKLGRGLSALLGEARREEPLVAPGAGRVAGERIGRAAPAPRGRRARQRGGRGDRAAPRAAAPPVRRAGARRPRRVDRRARGDPAGDRPPARRRALPAGRRRAPLARRAEGATS